MPLHLQVSCRDHLTAARAGPDAVAAGLIAFLKGPVCQPKWLALIAPAARVHTKTLEIFHSFTDDGQSLADAITQTLGKLHPSSL